MTNPTEEPIYVSLAEFGEIIAERCEGKEGLFKENRVRNVLLFADDIGMDGFDQKFVEGKPSIAMSERNISKFLKVLPKWKLEGRVRQQNPIEAPWIDYGNAEARYTPRKNSKLRDTYREFHRS